MVWRVCYGHFGFVVFSVSVSVSCGREWFGGCAMATLVLLYALSVSVSVSVSPLGLNGSDCVLWPLWFCCILCLCLLWAWMVWRVCYGHFGFVLFSVSVSCGLEWFEGCILVTFISVVLSVSVSSGLEVWRVCYGHFDLCCTLCLCLLWAWLVPGSFLWYTQTHMRAIRKRTDTCIHACKFAHIQCHVHSHKHM